VFASHILSIEKIEFDFNRFIRGSSMEEVMPSKHVKKKKLRHVNFILTWFDLQFLN
jgi:hypothetical protein